MKYNRGGVKWYDNNPTADAQYSETGLLCCN